MLILSLKLTPLKYIMHTPVLTISKKLTLTDAINKMLKHDIGCLVVTENKKPVGIITERDIMKYLGKKSAPKIKKLSLLMTKNLRTLKLTSSISDAFAMMQQLRIRRLPLLDKNGDLKGIVTERDIIGATNNYIKIHSRIQFVLSIVVFIVLIIFFVILKLNS